VAAGAGLALPTRVVGSLALTSYTSWYSGTDDAIGDVCDNQSGRPDNSVVTDPAPRQHTGAKPHQGPASDSDAATKHRPRGDMSPIPNMRIVLDHTSTVENAPTPDSGTRGDHRASRHDGPWSDRHVGSDHRGRMHKRGEHLTVRRELFGHALSRGIVTNGHEQGLMGSGGQVCDRSEYGHTADRRVLQRRVVVEKPDRRVPRLSHHIGHDTPVTTRPDDENALPRRVRSRHRRENT